ncbi:S-adenosyl-L-methionine-dependent methyltransferase [Absidia repens]|uniref:S-adenosyl-L-methionine-dependent methyltransferase n=1 Tax=Absidia repens TaxID=90262 RepID=A0A1X2ITF2_9FUNG|nr:S-adenosyl-L-methionine-dependent methyltransferase [Absidia repens]
MVRQSFNKHSTWIRRLLPACDNDPSLAKRQLAWMKEKIISDRTTHMNNNTTSLTLTKTEMDRLDTFITQRVDHHKPLQYILGTQPFYDLDIITRPPTLIPRWETEEWTYRLADLLRPYWDRQQQHRGPQRRRRILDVCTGSGCIALALAAHLPKNSTNIIGVDISEKAIQLANDNYTAHADLMNGNKVDFQLGDIYDLEMVEQQLLGGGGDDGPLDLVVSNPPYVTQDEYASLDPEVKQWEDRRALVADDLGTHLHRRLIELVAHNKIKWDAPSAANDGLPSIVMEIGGTHQVSSLQQALDAHGFDNIKVWKDLAGKDRVILAT